ncbi:MAG: hypothetical protein KAY12_04160, partial [Arenimonas sp.]|nr:hypothetical protein [Arenimonas sp.]
MALLLGATQAEAATKVSPKAKFTSNVAFRVSVPARELSSATVPSTEPAGDEIFSDFRREGEPRPVAVDSGFSGDGAVRAPAAKGSALSALTLG